MTKVDKISDTPAARPRVEKVVIDGRVGWLKRQESLAGLMRVQKGDPKDAFDAEKRAVQDMAARGLPAPRILDEGDDYFVTEDAGPTLRAILHDETKSAVVFEQALIDAAAALAALHAKGVAHGRPALKDICWDQGRVLFIDWERAGPKRNTRTGFVNDVILFFFSAISDTGGHGPAIYAAKAAYLEGDTGQVWHHAARRVRRLRWLAKLLAPVISRLQNKREFRAVGPFFAFFEGAPDGAKDDGRKQRES